MGHKGARSQLFGAIVLFVVVRAYILIGLEPQASDASVYFSNVVRALDFGETPYADFPIEFPPVAWWTMAAARLLDGPHVSAQPTVGEIAVARAAYMARFRMLMAGADVAAFALL